MTADSFKIFGVTLKDFDQVQNEYDSELVSIALELESGYFSRTFKISGQNRRLEELRVKQWTQRLCEENAVRCLHSEALLRNRNQYLRLLWKCAMILGKLMGPFKKVPPQVGEELPIIQNFQIKEIEMAVQTHMRQTKIKRQAAAAVNHSRAGEVNNSKIFRNRSLEDLKKLQERYQSIEIMIPQKVERRRGSQEPRILRDTSSKQYQINYRTTQQESHNPLAEFLDDHYSQMIKVQQKRQSENAAPIKLSYISTSSKEDSNSTSIPIPNTKSSQAIFVTSSEGANFNKENVNSNYLSHPSMLRSSQDEKRPFQLIMNNEIQDHAISVHDLQPALREVIQNEAPMNFDQFLIELRSVREETKRLLEKKHLFIKK